MHGELGTLINLLWHLGYDRDGRHPDGRSLVFVGDLCDRGEDSPGVFELVAGLVERGKAQCVVGNHELNLLRKESKEGNGWYHRKHADHSHEHLRHQQRATPAERAQIDRFMASLPAALERPGLRVVHACWHEESIRQLRACGLGLGAAYRHFEELHSADLAKLERQAAAERRAFAAELKRKLPKRPPFMPMMAAYDEAYQMANPLRVVTSGMERRIDPRVTKPFPAGGKWRFVERVPWWDSYTGSDAIAFGHYWRWRDPSMRQGKAKPGTDLFEDKTLQDRLGPKRNVFCVDFSIGYRHKERHEPGQQRAAWLAALRWPEQTLMFDDGHEVETK